MIGNVSILIVNWRSKDYLRRCLHTIRKNTLGCVGQIVVVDGGSFDGCAEMLNTEFPEVEFVQSRDNIGFGLANNLGFERVTQPTMLLLNPDTELKPGGLIRMLEVLAANTNIGIVGPRLLNTDGSLQRSSVMAFPTPLNQALRSEFLMEIFPQSSLWGSGNAYAAREPVPVECVSGACMLIRTELFRRLGGFRSDYFMYAEDMDLCFRAHRLGLVNYHVPDVEVIHHGGGSSSTQLSSLSTVMMRVAGETYMRVNHGPATARCYKTLQGLGAVIRILCTLPLSVLPPKSRQIAAKTSLKKSWVVLNWAARRTPKTKNNYVYL